jgi:hypothetical protein
VKQKSADPTSATATPSTICNGQSSTLSLVGGGGGDNETIHWYTSSCGGTPVGTGNSLSVSPTTTTTYYGRYEDGTPCSFNSGCETVMVTVKQKSTDPTSATATPSLICNGQSSTLSLVGGGGGDNETIHWYTSSCGGTLVGTGNGLSVSPTTTTTYYGRYEDGVPCGYNSACKAVTVMVNVAPTASNNKASQTIQYGGAITAVTITANDSDSTGTSLAVFSTSYTFNGGAAQPGLPSSLGLTDNNDGNGTLPGSHTWQVSGNITGSGVGTYVITVTVEDQCGATKSTSFTIIVVPACVASLSADAFYIGSTFAWASGNNNTATLTLSAGLKDCVGMVGDIRTARVTFAVRNGTTLTPIPGAQNLPVGLIDPNDNKQGTATAIVQWNLGTADFDTLEIAILVSGNYVLNNPATDAIVTVAKPPGTSSILGGGHIINDSTSSGYLKGKLGERTYFSLKLTFNQSGTNPKGKVTAWVVSNNKPDGTPDTAPHVYKLTSTAISVLAVKYPPTGSSDPSTASFSAKCTVQDVTNPNAQPISIDGGATMQIELTDGTPPPNTINPGQGDKISIYVLKKNGGVWFVNSLDNATLKAVQQPIATGGGDDILIK